MRFLPSRTRLLLPLVLVAWSSLGAAPAISEVKAYTAEVSPHTVPGGTADASFTATLTNASSQQQLGSANLIAPAGVTVVGASQPSVGGGDRGDATVRDGVVQLRNLGAAPGATVTVELTADVGCDAQGGSWSVRAKQANSFNGPPGNDLTLVDSWAHHVTDLRLDVLACDEVAALEFVAQPADAERAPALITSVPADVTGPPVAVEAVNAAGNGIAGVEVSLALQGGDVDAALSGGTAATGTDGIATFAQLSIDLDGRDYQLVATADDVTSEPSDEFSIWEDLEPCVAGEPCRGEVTGADVAATTTTTSRTSGLLGMSLSDEDLSCGDSGNHGPQVLTVVPQTLDGLATVTITISKEWDQRQPQNGASFYEVCFQGEAKPGEVEDPPAYLLPLCASPLPQQLTDPCLASRTKTQSGGVQLVVHMPTIDPKMI